MQLRVWGCLELPAGPGQSPGGVQGVKPPEALKIPHSIVSKIGQNSQINSKENSFGQLNWLMKTNEKLHTVCLS